MDIYGFPTAKANHSAHNTLGVSGFIDVSEILAVMSLTESNTQQEFANMDDLVVSHCKPDYL